MLYESHDTEQALASGSEVVCWHAPPNKALQLTARQHASQVTLSFSLNYDGAPQLKANVSSLLMKALEVSIDGKVIGVFVPPDDEPFSAMIANVPKTYMRAQILASNDVERWQWQLPDVQEGAIISFRMIEAEGHQGVPPHRVTDRNPEEVAEIKRLAKEGYERAMRERETES